MMVFVPTINYTRIRYVLFEGIRPVEEKFRKSGSQKRQATCSSCNLLQLPIPMIERRWREGKEKKNQDQEEKSWTRNTKEDTRTKRVRIEHLRQYTGYTRATIIPLLVRRRKVSHEKEESWGGQLCRRETKNDPSTLEPEFFFPLFSYFLIESKKKMHSVTGKQNTDADHRSEKEVNVCVCVYWNSK